MIGSHAQMSSPIRFVRVSLLGALVVFVCLGGQAKGQNFPREIRNSPPKDYVMVESCAPGKGTLWLDRQSADQRFSVTRRLPFEVPASMLGYQGGRLVLLQYRLPYTRIAGVKDARVRRLESADLQVGEGWGEFDHADMVYSTGTLDYPEPHYEVRLYLVSHSEHGGYCVGQKQTLQEKGQSQEGEKPGKNGHLPESPRPPWEKPNRGNQPQKEE